MYVCIYVCMYVSMYVCMYACMYVTPGFHPPGLPQTTLKRIYAALMTSLKFGAISFEIGHPNVNSLHEAFESGKIMN